MLPAPGTLAPDFALPLRPGEAPLRLSDYRGEKNVVLLFIPLAYSGVCTRELCLVRDELAAWGELDAAVVAVSADSPFVNQRFAAEYGLGFPVVSDFNREVMTEWGVRNDDFYGLRGVAHRSVFVVDREGRVAYAWMTEDADVLPDLEAVRSVLERLRG